MPALLEGQLTAWPGSARKVGDYADVLAEYLGLELVRRKAK
jgi:hypothetical protein